MKMKNCLIIPVILVFTMRGDWVHPMIGRIPAEQHIKPVKPNKENVFVFKRITLSGRNWEAVGSTIIIEKDGSYTVAFGRPGLIKKRKGRLPKDSLSELIKMIKNAKIFSMNDKFTGSKKTTRSWVYYNLIIETSSGSKSISFHSEDETVPQLLHKLVKKIIQITN